MRNITIRNIVFPVPDRFHHVAVDHDGSVYAFVEQPEPGNALSGVWISSSYHFANDAEYLGELASPCDSWRTMLYSFEA